MVVSILMALEDDAKNNTAALLDDDVNDDSARQTYSYHKS